MTGEVPVLSYESYLKELKDFITTSNGVGRKELNRLWISGGQGLEVGNVIITNKYPGKYTLINELYHGDMMETTVEYDVEEMLEVYENLVKVEG